MGATLPINFAINSYQARSGLLSNERLVNMYLEEAPADSPFKYALYGTPGLKVWKNLNQFEPVYGMHILGSNLYVVCGTTVYKIDENGNEINLGNVGTTPARVMMTNNRTQLTILTLSGNAYYTDGTTSVAQITDTDFTSKLGSSVTTLNGYTIFSQPDSDQFFISDLQDTTSYNSLKFATAEQEPDVLVRVFVDDGQLWLFGESTTEIWYNSANPDFPFDRVNGAFIERGCAAKYSIASDVSAKYWLGDDNVIYESQGYSIKRISTFPIEKAIESYSTVSDAFAFIYTQEGHKFYCITFPSAKKTWCYDIGNGLWHERESINPSTNHTENWSPNCHAYFARKNLVGDPRTGIIYELDLNIYTENNTPILRKAVSATQFKNFSRIANNRFTLVMDTGVGIDGSGQGADPEIMARFSVDGGKTWSNEMWQPIGEIGSYETEVFWTGVGFGRNLLTEIRISDPVKVAIVGAYLNDEAGYS